MKKIYLLFALACFTLASASAQDTAVQEERYEGNFNGQGQKDGSGTYYWADGTIYQGRWNNDKMQGRGKITYPDGSSYEGNFLDGIRSGFGIFTWANGDEYQGGFKDGKMHGRGILTQKDGTQHEGSWLYGKSFGEGTHTYPDGSQYIGEWVDNKRHGKGIMLYSDGRVEQGEWEKGEYVPCKCTKETVSVEEAFSMSQAVFVGEVFSIVTNDEEGYDQIGIVVTEYWKGELYPGRKVYMYAQYSSCDFVYFLGEKYLIYANKHPYQRTMYYPDKCTRTRKLVTASDMAEVNQLRAMVPCDLPDIEKRSVAYDFSEDEVCGCDGETYKNPYQANKAGIAHWKAGACENDQEKKED
ncbi:hypothetical protein V6R21_14995 [Limibacter armeniacum]|uniref:hypothetical protein n=1 Tax=Limibacter armeniacum TaxID=466084 RepID=UPI002FE57D32